MLSRSVGIRRTPGESSPPAPARPVARYSEGEARLKGRVIGKAIVLAGLTTLFLAFLVLNMGAVVEPRVRIPFLSYERPGVLPVMLVTAALSVACTLAALALLNARRQLGDAHRRSLTAAVEHEASRVKNGVASRRAVTQPVGAA